MKYAAWVVLIGAIGFLMADCIGGYPGYGPPALMGETIYGSPGPGYVWIGGYWNWYGGGYHWMRGHWERGRVGRAWVAPYWEHRGSRWVFRRGYWR